MTEGIIILLGIAISSIAFGFNIGYSKGIEHGINISIETESGKPSTICKMSLKRSG